MSLNFIRAIAHISSANTPEPFPSATVDPAKVQPGIMYAFTILGLTVALILLLLSMNRHLKKVKITTEEIDNLD